MAIRTAPAHPVPHSAGATLGVYTKMELAPRKASAVSRCLLCLRAASGTDMFPQSFRTGCHKYLNLGLAVFASPESLRSVQTKSNPCCAAVYTARCPLLAKCRDNSIAHLRTDPVSEGEGLGPPSSAVRTRSALGPAPGTRVARSALSVPRLLRLLIPMEMLSEMLAFPRSRIFSPPLLRFARHGFFLDRLSHVVDGPECFLVVRFRLSIFGTVRKFVKDFQLIPSVPVERYQTNMKRQTGKAIFHGKRRTKCPSSPVSFGGTVDPVADSRHAADPQVPTGSVLACGSQGTQWSTERQLPRSPDFLLEPFGALGVHTLRLKTPPTLHPTSTTDPVLSAFDVLSKCKAQWGEPGIQLPSASSSPTWAPAAMVRIRGLLHAGGALELRPGASGPAVPPADRSHRFRFRVLLSQASVKLSVREDGGESSETARAAVSAAGFVHLGAAAPETHPVAAVLQGAGPRIGRVFLPTLGTHMLAFKREEALVCWRPYVEFENGSNFLPATSVSEPDCEQKCPRTEVYWAMWAEALGVKLPVLPSGFARAALNGTQLSFRISPGTPSLHFRS
ncbi:hypothetical protein H920_12210 [Fukomys damarensis]|uniref:Uncharacterized protein n=1 Tax=Fukomys damarensis TaxID=885580 RepID=A0A091D7E9_FUKDA|nr:hypothetical protein H920_12210 [Fukomys damarensis]